MADEATTSSGFSTWLKKNSDQVIPWATLAALMLALIWVYGNSLDNRGAMKFWDNPKYSHGWLVPIFTMILLWMRHEPWGPVALSARWAGVGLLTLGVGIRLFATYYPNHVPEMDSFVVSVAGIFLMIGGWNAIRINPFVEKPFGWAGPAIVFLIFMFPLPGVLDAKLLVPMQKLATNASTYCLQTLGIAAYSEGNRIVISELQLGVVEACNGLRMLTIFVALAFAITLVTDRPIWERVVIVMSAIPIALAANIARITVTAILHLTIGSEWVENVFHDLDGWLMMPLALGLLYIEFQILSHLVIEERRAGPLQIGTAAGR